MFSDKALPEKPGVRAEKWTGPRLCSSPDQSGGAEPLSANTVYSHPCQTGRRYPHALALDPTIAETTMNGTEINRYERQSMKYSLDTKTLLDP